MRTIRTICTTIVVLLVATLSTSAQVREKEAMDSAMTGRIEAIYLEAKTLSLGGAANEGGLFHVNDSTTILSGDKKLVLSDLKVGDWVAVDSDEHKGSNIATYISVVDGP